MAYVTGIANSFADLLAALQTACVANGYTLSGSVLSKGTLHASVIYTARGPVPALLVSAGSGVSGGALTGASDRQSAQMGMVAALGDDTIPAGDVPFSFPMTYYIHINTLPDEVYMVVNYNVLFYQFIAFGKTDMPGLNGTGNWYAGTQPDKNAAIDEMDTLTIGGYMESNLANGGLFMGLAGYAASQNGAVDHQLDSATWGVEGAWRDWAFPIENSPNNWNGESILIPVRVFATRPAGFVTPVAELAHARFLSIHNLDDQQIITLGSDRWKVYPWWARGSRGIDNIGFSSHTTYSAAFGHALRYDGP